MSIRDHGWGDDEPCPDWCRTGAQHLAFRLDHRTDDYWHEGQRERFPASGEDRHGNQVEIVVSLTQHVQVDERGHYRHPVMVNFWGHELTTEQARQLSTALARLADQADSIN
jgi:hypothetical protein